MQDELSQEAIATWVGSALKKAGLSYAEAARQLTKNLGRSIDRAAVQKMTIKGRKGRKVAGDELIAISDLTGIAPPFKPTVDIVGYIGAGQVVFQEAQGPLGTASAPPKLTQTTVAVEVRGNSMAGIAEDGWIVYFDDRREPPTSDLIGRLCVVGLPDGKVYVKKLYHGTTAGKYHLVSTSGADILDQPVAWAAKVNFIEQP
jgi:SOS-response transcriptional repressor LexA